MRWYFKKKYNLTTEEYRERLNAQKGKCAICQRTGDESSKLGYLHLDHNHNTGEIRAFLCFNCNTGLGVFREDVELLNLAVKYLNFWKTAEEGDFDKEETKG
jgi:hypothetical protein